MKDVRVDKARLLETLQANRAEHIADLEITWEAFRKRAAAELERQLRNVKEAPVGGKVDLYVKLTVPQDHTSDYDRAIEMLGWELEDEVSLTESEFSQFVQDDWDWSGQFAMANVQYTGSGKPSKALHV